MNIKKYDVFPSDRTICICKSFEGKWYDGNITEFDEDEEYYKAYYECDGESEEYDWHSIYELVNNFTSKIRDKTKWDPSSARFGVRHIAEDTHKYITSYIRNFSLDNSIHSLENEKKVLVGTLSHDKLAQAMLLYQKYIITSLKVGEHFLCREKPCAAGEKYCIAKHVSTRNCKNKCNKCKQPFHLSCVGDKENNRCVKCTKGRWDASAIDLMDKPLELKMIVTKKQYGSHDKYKPSISKNACADDTSGNETKQSEPLRTTNDLSNINSADDTSKESDKQTMVNQLSDSSSDDSTSDDISTQESYDCDERKEVQPRKLTDANIKDIKIAGLKDELRKRGCRVGGKKMN